MGIHETIGGEYTGGRPDTNSAAVASSPEKNPDKKLPVKPDFRIGQVWTRPENGFRLEIAKQPSENRFDIVLKEEAQLGEKKWNASRIELEKMIASGYALSVPDPPLMSGDAAAHRGAGVIDGGPAVKTGSDISKEAEEEKSKAGALLESNETLEDPREDSRDEKGADEASSILEKYFVLSEEMEKTMTGVETAKSAIVEVLEKNTDTLGNKQYDKYLKTLEELIKSVNSVIDEETDLYRVMLEKKKVSVENAALLHQKLESLQRSIAQDIEYKKQEAAEVSENSVKASERQKAIMEIEKKIGEEKYEELCALVSSTWQGLQASLGGKTVSKVDRNHAWRTTLLPLLKEEIKNFLQAYTELREGEYEAVIGTLITRQGLPVKSEVFGRGDPERQKNVKQ